MEATKVETGLRIIFLSLFHNYGLFNKPIDILDWKKCGCFKKGVNDISLGLFITNYEREVCNMHRKGLRNNSERVFLAMIPDTLYVDIFDPESTSKSLFLFRPLTTWFTRQPAWSVGFCMLCTAYDFLSWCLKILGPMFLIAYVTVVKSSGCYVFPSAHG